ncbi:hypothetical protein GQ43DRAFT_126705 [Delitschia confertaspora ATCC 74209]|uniref:Uncharacterized protein n=1 Tax=Delitschia confertaspora ATCC 74209 TaxID=1513339 RepID=A0A9P4JMH4_9PLEO|nr:hypothetical protein GQ43DRAFT_126705 [Delitschia confertaspora ATCC 74209]
MSASIPLLRFLPILLPPVPLLFNSKTLQAMGSWYESLKCFPRLPNNPSPADHLKYRTHKLYYLYLITSPGFVLNTTERMILDTVILILLGAAGWCWLWMLNVFGGCVMRYTSPEWEIWEKEEAIPIGQNGTILLSWSGNSTVTLSIKTVFSMASGIRRTVVRGALL